MLTNLWYKIFQNIIDNIIFFVSWGAINIVTPSPEEEFYGDIKLELASDNEQNILAFLNIPIIDGLAATVSAYNMEHDNCYENINPDGPELLDIYSKGARAKIRWDVSDTFSLMLTGSVNEGSNNAGLNFENTRPAGAFAAVIEADPKRDRKVSLDQLPGAEVESSLFSFTAEWALPWFDTKLILSDDSYILYADKLSEHNGRLNLFNPSCFLFPEENNCLPGDTFKISDKEKLVKFANYKKFEFKQNKFQIISNYISIITFMGCLLYLIYLFFIFIYNLRKKY